MYKDFFGLQKLPFNLTPDPAFLFLPPKHREALAGLTYAVVGRKGFVVLTGEAGTGKTTLINSVLDRLPPERVESSIILNPTLSASEFLEGVLLDFEIKDLSASKAHRLWKFQEFLARTHHENRFAVLIIDEAHKLSLEVLEEIRLLGNYESASEKYLQVLLLGQPELDTLLDRRDLRQFRQRIALRLYIDPLAPSEVQQYMSFRWAAAGGRTVPPFGSDAVAAITHWSHGIPRLINSICDCALLMAYSEGTHVVNLVHVQEAAANLGLVETPDQIPSEFSETPRIAEAERPRVAVWSAPEGVSAQPVFPAVSDEDPFIPTLAGYGRPRGSSSLLRRLSEKLGFPH